MNFKGFSANIFKFEPKTYFPYQTVISAKNVSQHLIYTQMQCDHASQRTQKAFDGSSYIKCTKA